MHRSTQQAIRHSYFAHAVLKRSLHQHQPQSATPWQSPDRSSMAPVDNPPTNNPARSPIDIDMEQSRGSSASSSTASTSGFKHIPLPLPTLDGSTTAAKLDVSGGSVKLDHLGPMVVNTDGTLSRIGNWQNMTEIEQANTLRVLGKRNRERMDALRGNGGVVRRKT